MNPRPLAYVEVGHWYLDYVVVISYPLSDGATDPLTCVELFKMTMLVLIHL
jgi:hypothetical protein